MSEICTTLFYRIDLVFFSISELGRYQKFVPFCVVIVILAVILYHLLNCKINTRTIVNVAEKGSIRPPKLHRKYAQKAISNAEIAKRNLKKNDVVDNSSNAIM